MSEDKDILGILKRETDKLKKETVDFKECEKIFNEYSDVEFYEDSIEDSSNEVKPSNTVDDIKANEVKPSNTINEYSGIGFYEDFIEDSSNEVKPSNTVDDIKDNEIKSSNVVDDIKADEVKPSNTINEYSDVEFYEDFIEDSSNEVKPSNTVDDIKINNRKSYNSINSKIDISNINMHSIHLDGIVFDDLIPNFFDVVDNDLSSECKSLKVPVFLTKLIAENFKKYIGFSIKVPNTKKKGFFENKFIDEKNAVFNTGVYSVVLCCFMTLPIKERLTYLRKYSNTDNRGVLDTCLFVLILTLIEIRDKNSINSTTNTNNLDNIESELSAQKESLKNLEVNMESINNSIKDVKELSLMLESISLLNSWGMSMRMNIPKEIDENSVLNYLDDKSLKDLMDILKKFN